MTASADGPENYAYEQWSMAFSMYCVTAVSGWICPKISQILTVCTTTIANGRRPGSGPRLMKPYVAWHANWSGVSLNLVQAVSIVKAPKLPKQVEVAAMMQARK